MPERLRSHVDFRGTRHAIAALLVCATCACRGTAPDTSLERLIESRRLASDLLVQLAKSADAGNRAVMAGTEDASRRPCAKPSRQPPPSSGTRGAAAGAAVAWQYRRSAAPRRVQRNGSPSIAPWTARLLDLTAEKHQPQGTAIVVPAGERGGRRVSRRARRPVGPRRRARLSWLGSVTAHCEIENLLCVEIKSAEAPKTESLEAGDAAMNGASGDATGRGMPGRKTAGGAASQYLRGRSWRRG